MSLYSDPNQYDPASIPLATDIDAIYQSIENILSTNTWQRKFKPWLGSNLEKYLFEIMDNRTALSLEHEVIRAIGAWEPRVVLVTPLTKIVPRYDEHIYEVTIVFKLKGRGDQQYEYVGILESRNANIQYR